MIEVENLVKRYGGHLAVDHLSFTVEKGCVCGFLGREKEFVIPFEDVCQMGDDIVLVRLREEPPRPQK